MKGIAGRRLLDRLIEALAGHLPAGVRSVDTRVGTGGGLQIWAVPSTAAPGEEYGFWDVSGGDGDVILSIGQRGVWLPWGLGSWVPMPRRTRVRGAAVAALEAIHEAVREVDERWPAPDAQVAARVEGDDVLVWFESRAAERVPPLVRLPLSVFD
ncbi:hypothetical protein [Actinoplanes palleronii]|uniref:Uncharacterized protein n=1 Tax=Actinoplanes palleronii TaxID=113570 RepID=A0ABQ4BG46_9ACTN|nr:hypothetical protein [Actinoplanes palleronii]GIE69570.1 hypothetical protein Apa02nite_056780 [Actinoplanes palleronii]